MFEQQLLAKKATGIAGEPAVRSDDPMTRHNNGDRIRAVRGADRPTCSGFTEGTGNWGSVCKFIHLSSAI